MLKIFSVFSQQVRFFKPKRHCGLETKRTPRSLRKINLPSIFFLISLTSTFAFFCTKNEAFAESTNCTLNCHTDLANESHLPSDKLECQDCHKPTLKQHPQKGALSFSLSNEKCIGCHPQALDYIKLHPPVAAGHCSGCHNPHSNKNGRYIKLTGKLICYLCHDEVFSKNDTYLHGDLKQGKCSPCHAHHGSKFPKLLKGDYSPEYLNDYKKEHYQICFRCHKIDLLLHPKTSYNTNFRDGKNNLHYKHINKPSNGKGCKNCHATHAGTKEKLMKETVLFGNWKMPINFTLHENGGSCAPGCHAPRKYDRTIRRSSF